MRHILPYIVILIFILVVLLSMKFGKFTEDTKPVNYTQKYDSLQQQLELQRTNRDSMSNTIDSLNVLLDSLTNADQQIQVEIREVPGTYNKYNSDDLRNKMIEAYEQRE